VAEALWCLPNIERGGECRFKGEKGPAHNGGAGKSALLRAFCKQQLGNGGEKEKAQLHRPVAPGLLFRGWQAIRGKESEMAAR